MPEKPENMDDFLARVRHDEMLDELEQARGGQTKMSVREYANARGIQPQLMYYYVRQGYIQTDPCICGRMVIDIESADKYLAEKAAKDAKR
jgi:hypothetical protein